MQELQSSTHVSILYVDPDREAREHAVKLLSPLSLHIETADNGTTGLALFDEHRPDILVADLSLAGTDGFQMARIMRSRKPDMMIVLVTADRDALFLVETTRIRVNRYVLKPVKEDILLQAVKDCVTRLTLERKIKSQHAYIRKLSMAVEQSPCTVVITDAKGVITYVNPKFTTLTGFPEREAIGQNPRILKSNLTPPETYAELWATITAGREWHGELLNRKKNGDLYWEQASISPLLDEEGTITNFVGVKHEITEKKRMLGEIETLNSTLAARAAELEISQSELATFNYRITHDLRGPLSSIHGFSQLLLRGASLDEQSRDFVQDIFDQAQRMEQLIKSLTELSRVGHCALKHEVVDLGFVAHAAADDLRRRHPGRTVSLRFDCDVTARGDGRLLRIAMDNLIGNAWKYTASAEHAVIEFGQIRNRSTTVYFVRDNGTGFDEERAEQLFAPFQRLQEAPDYSETGIGLATVYRVISRHGGRIWAEGKVGEGATFYFTLP